MAWIERHGLLGLGRWEAAPEEPGEGPPGAGAGTGAEVWRGRGAGARSGPGALPPALRARLVGRLRDNAAQNLYAVARFQAVVDALEGIPVCPLKGIHLLGTIYREDPECRVLGDLDLLVPRDRVDEAVARLGPLGLEETPLSHRIREVSPERFLTDGRLPVELHTRLGVKHGARSAWEDLRPRPGRVHGRQAFTLDRETTLVHLVAHLVKHRPFSRLGWVEDVLRWIRRGVDAGGALARARELGALRSFVAGVGILRRALGPAGLPAVSGDALRPPGHLAVRLHERLVWGDLLRDPWSAGPGRPLGRTLSVLLLADRPGDLGGFLRTKLAERWQRR